MSDNLEADDLLGSYARREADAGGSVLVMTGDRDMFQCATDRVTILYVRTGSRGAERGRPGRGQEALRRAARSSCPTSSRCAATPPTAFPGAKGIGEKGAADLLKRHGSLETALEGALRETKPRVRTALTSQREELLRFKEIATLRDVDVELPADRELDRAGAAAAARERGMDRLAARLEPQPS